MYVGQPLSVRDRTIFPCAIQYNVLVIKAIIFDIGGVVTYNIGGYIRNDIIKALGVTKDQYEGTCHILVPLLSTGKITEEEFWQRFRTITKTTKVPPENLWSREFSKRRKLRKDVVQIIKELKKNGIKLAALSNVIRSHSQVNDEKGIYRLFDVRILSYEVGLKKPDPQIYMLTLKKLGANPEETVFIDNKLQNVKVAGNLGFNGIYYKSPGQLRKSLERHKLI
ncbi:HAD family phosphatase [Candidatus Collierbacteria bacterium]|nr:HAD family phosphatase [Candidatus Collierbacteria bacterium]